MEQNSTIDQGVDERRARLLQTMLERQGVTAFLHWDRCPWGVRIPLTDDEGEYAPALFVLTELQTKYDRIVWIGSIGNFESDDDAGFLAGLLNEAHIEWLEADDSNPVHDLANVQNLAAFIKPVAAMLKTGASRVKEFGDDCWK